MVNKRIRAANRSSVAICSTRTDYQHDLVIELRSFSSVTRHLKAESDGDRSRNRDELYAAPSNWTWLHEVLWIVAMWRSHLRIAAIFVAPTTGTLVGDLPDHQITQGPAKDVICAPTFSTKGIRNVDGPGTAAVSRQPLDERPDRGGSELDVTLHGGPRFIWNGRHR
jgi:hypothetical protein